MAFSMNISIPWTPKTKKPWYNRDKAISMECYDEADIVLKVNSLFGENVTRPISDNKHTELGGGGGAQDV